MAVFSRLIPSVVTAFGVQSVLALIFVPQQNEKYYDLGGALGFISTTFVSLYYPSLRAKFWDGTLKSLPAISTFAHRQLLVSAALGIWSTRLGTFLVKRVIKAGGDSRFDEVKRQPKKFTAFWMAQATWTLLVGLPVYLCNAIPASAHPPLGPRDYAAVGLFAASFLFEVTADHQKSIWRRQKDAKEHDEKFLTSGLWSLSRHPKHCWHGFVLAYVGEVGIWTGIWAMSTAALQTAYFPRGTVALAAVSPVFTYFLLRKVSGVPPLERSGDKKYGDDPKWQEYKKTVPIFFPWGPKD